MDAMSVAFGALLVFVGMLLCTGTYLRLLSQVKKLPESESSIRACLARCQHHRTALSAYHTDLCERFAINPHSHEGDLLAEVIFDGRDWDEVRPQLLNARTPDHE